MHVLLLPWPALVGHLLSLLLRTAHLGSPRGAPSHSDSSVNSFVSQVFSKSVAANGSYPTPNWKCASASLRGEPLLPVQQLAAILPPQSAALLPAPYRQLLLDPNSPLTEFYPPLASVGLTDDDKNRYVASVQSPRLTV